MNEKLLLAVKEAEIRDALSVPDIKEYPYARSSQHMEYMARLLKKMNAPYYSVINTVGKRIACIIVAFIALLFSTVMSVEALRLPFIQFVKESFTRFIQLTYSNKDKNSYSNSEAYMPSYVPEGYELLSKTTDNSLVTIMYSDQVGKVIVFKQYEISEVRFQIDNQNTLQEQLNISGKEALYYEKDGTSTLTWKEGKYLIFIFGQLEKEELIRMAESVK